MYMLHGFCDLKGCLNYIENKIKIISFKDKDDWELRTKYNIGRKREE